jgi:metal-dependent amidase/aminoacylase/carboxypeptidase family protein
MTETKDVAKDQAASVGQGVAEAGQHVAGVAKEQTAEVTAEAGKQAKDLLGQAQSQLKEQATVQQQKLVSGLQSLRDELNAMVSNNNNPGVAADLARQAADRTGSVATWLDRREPAAVLDDFTDFARRRPGAFLAVAAGIGLVAGRLTRGLKAPSDEPDPTALPTVSPPPAATAPAITTSVDVPAEIPRASAMGL